MCVEHTAAPAANIGLLVIRNELRQIKNCRPLKAEDDSIACALNKSSFNTTQHTALYCCAMAHLLCEATPLDVDPTVKLFSQELEVCEGTWGPLTGAAVWILSHCVYLHLAEVPSQSANV